MKNNNLILFGFLAIFILSPLAQSAQDSQDGALKTLSLPLTELKKKIPYAADSFHVLYAGSHENEDWYQYHPRPPMKAASSEELLRETNNWERAQKNRALKGEQLPWSLVGKPEGAKQLFKLRDVVIDRIYDNGKSYVKMYHGTTSNNLKYFTTGTGLRFDVGKGALGTGFYLTADINEAMFYACERLKVAKNSDPEARGMVFVFGVLDNNIVQGKTSLSKRLSNDLTGEPLDPQIFFKRNSTLFNQFNFSTNVAPYLMMFSAIILEDNFATSSSFSDGDGFLEKDKARYETAQFHCNKFAPTK